MLRNTLISSCVLAVLVGAMTAQNKLGVEAKPTADAVKPGLPEGKPQPKLDGQLPTGHGEARKPVVGGADPRSNNPWFPTTDLDLGTYFGHEEAVGVFPFRNPRSQAIDWTNLQGSCTCSRAVIRVGDRRYELQSKPEKQLVRLTKGANGIEQQERVQQIQIGAGEEGTVEVHMEMHQVSGAKSASLDIHTSDPSLPQLKLKWQATGAQMFQISPSEYNLNTMAWNEVREFTFTVTSPIAKNFEILRMDPNADKAFKVTWDKQMNGEMAIWTIRGTYGPVPDEKGTGGMLKFYTDTPGDNSFTVRVGAMVKGPLEVKPGGFLPLGRLSKGVEVRKEVVFEPNDGTKLEATSLTFDNLSVPKEAVRAESRQVDGNLVVTLVIGADAPLGMLKGDLLVKLNHPLVQEKLIVFNGFVRQ